MQQKMTSKIHASMFRTKELSESDGQNNAAISLLLRKNDRFMPQKLLIRRGARLHLPIVTCFCSRCCCCCFRCCCRCWQLGSVFSRQIDMPPADVSQTRTETNGHGRGCGRTRTDTGGQRRPDGRTAGQRVKSGWQTCIHQEKRL